MGKTETKRIGINLRESLLERLKKVNKIITKGKDEDLVKEIKNIKKEVDFSIKKINSIVKKEVN